MNELKRKHLNFFFYLLFKFAGGLGGEGVITMKWEAIPNKQ